MDLIQTYCSTDQGLVLTYQSVFILSQFGHDPTYPIGVMLVAHVSWLGCEH